MLRVAKIGVEKTRLDDMKVVQGPSPESFQQASLRWESSKETSSIQTATALDVDSHVESLHMCSVCKISRWIHSILHKRASCP